MKLTVILLSCFALMAGCGDKSNPAGPGPVHYSNLVDSLIGMSLTKSGDTSVLKITMYTSSGAPETQIANYNSADIYTTNAIRSYHLVSMTKDANGVWTAGAVQTTATPAGVALTGVNGPVLDFKDALKVITDNNLVLVTASLDLFTPLVVPAVTTAMYQSMCAGTSGINVVSINSVSGAVTI